MGTGYPVFNEEAPWLYARGWGLLLSSPVLPPCWCPAGPITLYQEAAAAPLWLWSACPSLWSLGPHFPVAAWETSLSCSRMRKAQVWQRTSPCCRVFEDGLKTSSPSQKSPGNPPPTATAASPREMGGSPPPIGHAALFTSPHNANVPYFQKGRERKDGEMNSQDRAGLMVYL